MKIVFLSNFLNHHQLPVCLEFQKKLGNGFKFVATTRTPKERLDFGYYDLNENYDFVVCAYSSQEEMALAQKVCDEADVVIFGSAPESFLVNRIRENKVIFKFQERPLKKGIELCKYIPRFIKWHKNNPQRKPMYILCASAYTSADYAKFGLFINRCYKWGYFPSVIKYDDIDKLISKKKPMSLLWVARLIPLKHPEVAFEVAKRLREQGYNIELNIIGNGEMEQQLKEKIAAEGLEDFVFLRGAMNPEQVREYMDKSEIFLFTSDRNEGWGAVINEAMNSACAVVSSHVTGVTPFLVEDGINGFMYEDGNLEDLYKKTKWLLDNEKERKQIAKNAYETMVNEWNAENAAEKFIILANAVLNGEKLPNPFEKGVCSRAKILKEDEVCQKIIS